MKKLSLNRKFILLQLPLLLLAGVVSQITWKALSNSVGELETAGHLNDLAAESRFYVMEMSDAMKAYIIDPKNKSELERKKKADDNNTKAIAEMKSLTSDPESLKLIQEMAQFDDKNLNPAEDAVMKLVEDGKNSEAQVSYAKAYAPLRALYMELHGSLSARVKAEVQSQTRAVEQRMRHSAYVIMTSLILGILLIAAFSLGIVRKLSKSIEALVERLYQGSDVVTNTSTQISQTGAELSQSTTEQAAALQETVAAIEEVSAMVSRNAENAKQSLTVSGSSHDAASRGKRVVEQMISSIQAISESNSEIIQQIETSNREISEIVQVISEIGNKTKVINDIVFQTKLLSFNASVEAARAGEHGKGFAVVAEEVGNLAAMSGKASKEISDMLSASISKVEKIVHNTQSKVEGLVRIGKDKVEAGTDVAQKCGNVLDEIVGQVAQLKQMVEEIATASTEQAQGVQEINKAMGQMDQVTSKNAESSQSAAQASEELNQQAVDLKQMVASLSVMIRGGEEVTENLKATAPKAVLPKSTPRSQQIPGKEDHRFKAA